MGLKDMILSDIKEIFLNLEEFGENHIVDGEVMCIIIDEFELIVREKKERELAEGLHIKQLLFYVSEEEYGPLPLIGRRMELDGDYFEVTDAISEGGMHSISLEARES